MNKRNMKKQWIRGKVVLILVLSFMLGSIQMVYGQENTASLQDEIAAKQEGGAEIYELRNADGELMGYYEPYSETNPEPANSRSIAYKIDWSIGKKTNRWSNNNISFLKGDKINVNISQNPSGGGYTGYIGLYDNDNGTIGYTVSSTNGWNGTITVGYNGHFSFAIQNSSNYTIKYFGTYSF